MLPCVHVETNFLVAAVFADHAHHSEAHSLLARADQAHCRLLLPSFAMFESRRTVRDYRQRLASMPEQIRRVLEDLHTNGVLTRTANEVMQELSALESYARGDFGDTLLSVLDRASVRILHPDEDTFDLVG